MDETDLKSYIRAVELGSISAASRELYTTSQAIDMRLKRLEARVGVKLLERSKRGVSCTPAGMRFLETCKNVELYFSQAIDECRRIDSGNKHLLRITLSSLAPLHISTYQQLHPEVSVEASYMEAVDDISSLFEGTTDAFEASDCLFDCSDARMRFTEVAKLPLCCAFSPGHVLDGKEFVTFRDLIGQQVSTSRLDFILAQGGDELRDVADRIVFRDRMFQRGDILRTLTEGGVFIMPRYSVLFTSALLPVSSAPLDCKPASYGIATRAKTSPDIDAFVEYCKKIVSVINPAYASPPTAGPSHTTSGC